MSFTTSDGTAYPTTDDGTPGSSFDVTGLSNGNWAVAGWNATSVDGRIYAPDGAVLAQFEAAEGSTQYSAIRIVDLDAGAFAVAWEVVVNGQFDVFFRLFNADGSARGEAVQVVVDEVEQFDISQTLAGLGATDNALVVGFREDRVLYYRRYDLDGSPLDEAVVTTGQAEMRMQPDGAGGLWMTYGSTNAATARRLDADGNPVGADFDIDGIGGNATLVPLGNGLLLAVGNRNDIEGRLYNPDGTPAGAVFDISGLQDGRHVRPAMANTSDGGAIVAWTASGSTDIGARRIGPDGAPLGEVFQANSDEGGRQVTATVAGLVGGEVAIGWIDTFTPPNSATQFVSSVEIFQTELSSGPQPIRGTPGNDELDGTAASETIEGLAGNDTINNIGGGRDLFDGGPGSDTLVTDVTGFPEDVVRFDLQALVHGRNQSNVGQDTLAGVENFELRGSWDSIIIGDANANAFITDAGDDTIRGAAGSDFIRSGSGEDEVFGGDGFDTLFSGDGEDTVTGGNGRDLVFLNQGDDLYIDNAQGGVLGRDTVWAGLGDDTIEGGNGDDTFRGEAGEDVINARLGNDLIFGGNQADTISAGAGNDTAHGGNGRDLVFLNQGDDVFVDNGQGGDLGNDIVWAGLGDDTIEGGNGDDTFRGQDGNDVINARLGDDLVFGGNQFDTISAGDGDDTVNGGNGRDTVFLNQGDDVYIDNAQGGDLGRDAVWGGFGDDTIQGGNGNDTFRGEAGDDVILARLGNDLVFGGAGRDALNGGGGVDTITGGGGADVFVFAAADQAAAPDLVTDFERGIDVVRLAGASPGQTSVAVDSAAGTATISVGGAALARLQSTDDLAGFDVGDLVFV